MATLRDERGDGLVRFGCGWKDSEGEPIPLASARVTFRHKVSSEDAELELTKDDSDAIDPLDGGLDLSDPGRVFVYLTPAMTADLTSGDFAVVVVSAAGEVKTLREDDYLFKRTADHG